jgi:hypothetical protein
MKTIELYHPVDPESKEKFSVFDRITVKDYRAKLTDFCFCYQCGIECKKFKHKVKKYFKGKNNEEIIRPESMEGMPESGSSSDSSD